MLLCLLNAKGNRGVNCEELIEVLQVPEIKVPFIFPMLLDIQLEHYSFDPQETWLNQQFQKIIQRIKGLTTIVENICFFGKKLKV